MDIHTHTRQATAPAVAVAGGPSAAVDVAGESAGGSSAAVAVTGESAGGSSAAVDVAGESAGSSAAVSVAGEATGGSSDAVSVAGASAGASLDSTAQTGSANGVDWQEEIYQKITSMRETYLSDLNDKYWKTASAIQQCPQPERLEKLRMFKTMMERLVLFLRLEKHEIQLSHKEKLLSAERHIRFLLPQPSMHTSQAQNTYAHQPPTMDSD